MSNNCHKRLILLNFVHHSLLPFSHHAGDLMTSSVVAAHLARSFLLSRSLARPFPMPPKASTATMRSTLPMPVPMWKLRRLKLSSGQRASVKLYAFTCSTSFEPPPPIVFDSKLFDSKLVWSCHCLLWQLFAPLTPNLLSVDITSSCPSSLEPGLPLGAPPGQSWPAAHLS